MLSFRSAAWAELTQVFLNTLASSTSVVANLEYISGSCYKTCIVETERSEEGFTALIPVKVDCDNQCCIRRSAFQYLNGVWVDLGTQLLEPTEDCDPVGKACPPRTQFSTNCSGGCRELIGF